MCNDVKSHFTVQFLPKCESSAPVNSFIHTGSFQNIREAEYIPTRLRYTCVTGGASESRLFLPDLFHSVNFKCAAKCVFGKKKKKKKTCWGHQRPQVLFLCCFWRFRGTLLRDRGCWLGRGCPRSPRTFWTSPRGGTSTPATCCPLWRSSATWPRRSRERATSPRQTMCR